MKGNHGLLNWRSQNGTKNTEWTSDGIQILVSGLAGDSYDRLAA